MSSSQLEVVVFDVGEGNSAAIGFEEDGEKKWGIIDCCQADWQNEPPVLTFLRHRGITALEFICVTHFHFDHYRGLSHVLHYCETNNYPIRSFWRCGTVNAVDVFHRMHEHATKVQSCSAPADKEKTLTTEYEKHLSLGRTAELRKILLWCDRMIQRRERKELKFWPKDLHGVDKGFKRYGKRLVFHCLAPITISKRAAEAHLAYIAGDLPKALEGDSEQANHASVILFLVFGKAKLLFGGDAGVEVWREVLDEAEASGQFKKGQVKADLFKASHHGSQYSSDLSLWSTLLRKDATVVISANYWGNSYGHPHVKTLDELRHIARKMMPIQVACTNAPPICCELARVSQTKSHASVVRGSNIPHTVALIAALPGHARFARPSPNQPTCYGTMEFVVDPNTSPVVTIVKNTTGKAAQCHYLTVSDVALSDAKRRVRAS